MPLKTVGGRELYVTGRMIRIARLEGDKYKFLDAPERLIADLRKSRERIDIFTFMQKLPEKQPRFRYPMEWDNLAALPISTYDHWWTKQLDNKTRNMVRKAEKKGVSLGEVPFDDALIRAIWGIYNECPVRQGKLFPHYGMTLEAVRKYAGTFLDSSIFIGAFSEDNMIGFLKLTMDDTRTQAGLMHILSMVRHRDKAPTNALIAQAVRSCADRGIPYLVYSNFAYGKKQKDSLSEFKERHGFQRVELPRYYVPLTAVGRAALRLGLHHRFVERVPEPVLAKLRELRNSWYHRKLQTATETS